MVFNTGGHVYIGTVPRTVYARVGGSGKCFAIKTLAYGRPTFPSLHVLFILLSSVFCCSFVCIVVFTVKLIEVCLTLQSMAQANTVYAIQWNAY